MRGELIHLTKGAYSLNCIHVKPLIYQGRIIYNKEVRHRRVEKDTRGDVLIRGIWERQTYTIIDIRFGGVDCAIYNKEPMSILLVQWGKGGSTSTVITVTSNGNTFLCIFFH